MCPLPKGQPEPALEPQRSVLEGGLWGLWGWAQDNHSPNLSSHQRCLCFPCSCQEEERTPYDRGGQSQGPPWPGPWVWPHQWAPHLPCVLESEYWSLWSAVGLCDGRPQLRGLEIERNNPPSAPPPQRSSGCMPWLHSAE